MRRTRYLFTAAIAAVLMASPLGLVPAQANVPNYSIGDTGPGGGVVFITPSTTGNSTGYYFEARLSAVDRRGCQERVALPDVLGATIGAGSGNTRTIRDECIKDAGNTADNSAFVWVRSTTIGGYSDWFIPNSGEMSRLWAERADATVSAIFTGLINSGVGGDERRVSWVSEALGDADPNNPCVFLLDAADGNMDSCTTINGRDTNFVIARSFTPTGDASQIPPPVLQQLGLLPGHRCADVVAPELNWAGVPSGGWSQSWAEWAVPVTGGPVCVREMYYDPRVSRWTVAS